MFASLSPDTQLAVCANSCSVLETIYEKCSAQFNQIKAENSTSPLIQYVDGFNCSAPESYLVPGVPVDAEVCISAYDLC